jgi:hypothetical protein
MKPLPQGEPLYELARQLGVSFHAAGNQRRIECSRVFSPLRPIVSYPKSSPAWALLAQRFRFLA